ncbi:MAG: metalloregulator ArsR/SmtB family transcription factor [Halobacteria archaeon]|nr:metalloregulator ArsR/SmtB family transcription factor [Halobacteria archaeon]
MEVEDDEIELESRREIYQTIDENPGIHFRELLRRLDYAQGTLQYHLRWLEDENLIQESQDSDFTRYYTRGFETEDKRTMNALRREYSRRIIAYLSREGELTTSELAELVGKSNSTVSWHLSRLHDAGIVEKKREGRSVLYSLKDESKVKRLYTVHQKSFKDRLVDNILGLWDSY